MEGRLARGAVLGAVVTAAALGLSLGASHSPLALTAVLVGAAIAIASAFHPRFGLLLWIAVVAAVPHWLGLELRVYLPPLTLVGLLLVPALLGGPRVALQRTDLVLGSVLVTVTFVVLLGSTGLTLWASILTQWSLAYVIGRRMTARVGVEWAAMAFSWVMVLVGVFALLEFVQDWHPFVTLRGPSMVEASWSTIISRGGLVRSEAAFGHPIALGGALVMAIPLLATSATSVLRRTLGVSVLLAGAAVTLSRGPLLAAGLTILLLVWASRGFKLGGRVSVLLAAGLLAWIALPVFQRIASDDATNVSASNAIRTSVFSGLREDMQPFGVADGVTTGANGALSYRGFTTVDNAFLVVGMQFGYVVAGVVALVLMVLTWSALRRRTSPAGIALVGQWPVLLTVALITQYAAIVWFVVGLAVTWASVEHSAGGGRAGPATDNPSDRQKSTTVRDA